MPFISHVCLFSVTSLPVLKFSVFISCVYFLMFIFGDVTTFTKTNNRVFFVISRWCGVKCDCHRIFCGG